jgi:hypothetical protein
MQNRLYKTLDELVIKNRKNQSILQRLKDFNYTDDEIALYQKALDTHDDDLMNSLPCKCTDQYQCEKCRFIKLRDSLRKDNKK